MLRSVTNPKVDWFFEKDTAWKQEYAALRDIVLECGLTEELKWGVPCYTLNDHNVVLIHGFKQYCALLFHKGALLKDDHKLLIQQTDNVQGARQIRFTGLQEIVNQRDLIKTYIFEAAEVEKAGLKVDYKPTEAFEMPEEFKTALDTDPGLRSAFERLTPGRQRGYLLYFASAKQAKTRQARVEKCRESIMQGKGLDD